MKRCAECKRWLQEQCHRCNRELSAATQPKVPIKDKAKIERKQAHFVRLDKKGRPIWELRDMAVWQWYQMPRKSYQSSKQDLGALWDHMVDFEREGKEFDAWGREEMWRVATKDEVDGWKKWATMVREIKKTNALPIKQGYRA